MGKKNKDKFKIIWFLWLILGGFLVKFFFFFFKKRRDIEDNLEDFIEKEEKEVEELTDGKESLAKYCFDSFCVFKDYFIPNDQNDHKPKILRSKSLLIIAIVLILIKSAVTGYLFFIYPNTAKMTEVMISQVLELTNSSRLENGIPALKLSSALSASAKAKAEDMVLNNYFAHYSPDGKKPWDWISRAEYPYLFVGENLAMNFSSAASAHIALMQSPSHKENILNSRFSDVGLAVISGEIDGKKTNLLVELFATQKEVEIAAVAKETETEPEVSENIPVPEKEIEITKEDASQPEEKIEVAATKEPEAELEQTPQKGEEEQTAPEPIEIDTVKPDESSESEIDYNLATTTINTTEKEEAQEDGAKQEIEFTSNISQEEIAYFSQDDLNKLSAAAVLVKISKYIYLAVLILLSIALAVNIFLRITIRHKSVVIQTIVLILFVLGLISMRLHFLENILGNIAIM